MLPPPPRPTLFPYTTLFRSQPEHEASSVSLSAYARLLRQNRNFRRLWMAQIVSEIGDWFYSDRKSTRLNSSHTVISYAVFCLKKKNQSKHSCQQSFQLSTPE